MLYIVLILVFFGAFIYSRAENIMYEERQPCEYFANKTQDNIPARCLKYFQENIKQSSEEVVNLEKFPRVVITSLKPVDRTEKAIRDYLKRRGSPMWRNAKDFVKYGKQYDIDPRLLVAIAVVESGAGKHNFRKFNAFGLMTKVRFTSYSQSIKFAAKTVEKLKHGLNSVSHLGSHYCPNSAKWVRDIRYVTSKIR